MEENAVLNGNVHISHCVDALGMDGSQMCSSMVQSSTGWLICFSNLCLTVEGRLVVFCFPLSLFTPDVSSHRFNIIHKAFKWKAVFPSVIKRVPVVFAFIKLSQARNQSMWLCSGTIPRSFVYCAALLKSTDTKGQDSNFSGAQSMSSEASLTFKERNKQSMHN